MALLLGSALVPAAARAQEDVEARPRADSIAARGADSIAVPGADSIAARGADSIAARGADSIAVPGADSIAVPGADSVAAHPPDSIGAPQEAPPDTVMRIGRSRVPLPWEVDLGVAAARRAPPGYTPGRPASDWLASRLTEVERTLAAARDTLWMLYVAPESLPRGFDARRFLGLDRRAEAAEMVEPDVRGQQIEMLPDALRGIADLDLQIDGTGQINSRWQNYSPCTLGAGQRCNAGAVPDLAPEFQLRAIARGTISKRVHVDVDFDQTREYNATNKLSVYYEGLPGEILEHVEVGQVTLPLPRSQYISQAIPAGNFGVRSDARLGPLSLRGVFAEQEGSVATRKVTLDTGTGGQEGVLQDVSSVVDDAAYATGQFFFVVDPRLLTGYPDVDVINLQGPEAPPELQPGSSIKLYRHEINAGQPQNVESGIIQARAVAVRPPDADPTLPDSTEFQGFFRPLVEGEDYIVHRSGLWIVLRSRLQRDEALAAAWVSVDGDTVGDFRAEETFREIANGGSGPLPRLVLLKDAVTHRPGGVTWEREMHQIYRISSSDDVEAGSVQLVISQGPVESGPVIRELDGVEFSFLEIFGLDATPRDDRLDEGRIWRPAASGEFAGTNVIAGSYLVFPTLEPFKTPPPLESSRLPSLEGQPFPLAEADRNTAIYDEPTDQIRVSSYRYRLNFDYRSRSTGPASSFSLGAIGIREGSERVTLNGQELTRGSDYTVDYEIGQLTLLRPGDLLSGTASPDLEVRFEQKPLFQVQRKSILGLTGTWSLGDVGAVNFVGLSQRESTVLSRPEVGLEPGAVQLGGLTAQLRFEPAALDRFTNSLPGIRTDVASAISFDGEIAGSSPTTNRLGATYVDDFEGGSRLQIGLGTRSWRFGSPPTRPDVDAGFLPAQLDLTNRIPGVWQSQWDEAGQIRGPLQIQQIDPALRVLNPGTAEPVLWVTLPAASAGGAGWFSVTNPLSEAGLDLTNIEFLEFYASTLGDVNPAIAMIVDVGLVSEDVLIADSLGNPSGLGVLNQEVDPLVGVWGNPDDTGLWDRGCVSIPDATAFPLGDERANCARNNGLEDTEDLDNDNFLDQDERYFRYIIPLTQASRYLVRETGGEFEFNLYRVPLRIPDLEENTTGQGQQNVKQVRITFTSDAKATVLLSRMEFSGSPWLKRAGSGSVSGFVGEQQGTGGQVVVGTISTTDDRYVSPPGVTDQQADRTDEVRQSGQIFNEQSLRLAFEDVPPGDRVEVYRRYTERSRDFLTYRELRAWVLAVEGDWGPASPLRFYVRLGSDPRNFYLYRTPLAVARPDPVREDWNPEKVIDFDRWIALRAEAERRLIEEGASLPPDSFLVVWDADVFADGDSSLAVVLGDRSRAPNLSAIRELTVGVENLGTATAGGGEVWIDDLRLGQASDRGGVAMRGQVQMNLGDVARIETAYRRRNPFYRQLGDAPPYQSSSGFEARAQLQLGRFLPDAWGLAMPLDVDHSRSSEDPYFLTDTDVRASEIQGLRTPEESITRWSVSLHKQTPSGSALARATIDGLRLGYSRRSSNRTATQTEADGSGWTASAGWSRQVADASFPLLPSFLRSAIDALPDFLSESTLFQNLRGLRFRWTPRELNAGADLARARDQRFRYQSSVRATGDANVDPSVDVQAVLQPSAGIQLQPFPSLAGGLRFASNRDLAAPFQRVNTAPERELLRDEKKTVLGLDVGWETSRAVRGNLAYQPELATWFEPRLTMNTSYVTNRNPSYIDSTGDEPVLLRDISVNRDLGVDVSVTPVDLLGVFGVPEALDATGFAHGLREVWDRIRPLRLNWSRQVNANFDRRNLDPSFGDQLVLASFRSLRIRGADTASAAGRNTRWGVSGGYRLPWNLDAEVEWNRSDVGIFTPRSFRGTRETEWPYLGLRWRSVPIPGSLEDVFRSVSLGGTWRKRDRLVETTTGQNQGTTTDTRSANVLMIFANGFNVSYQLDLTTTDRSDQTGSGQSKRTSHSVRATGTVAPPGFLGFVRAPLRLSAEYSINGNFDCREIGGTGFGQISEILGLESCTPHIDQSTQNLSVTVDTDFTGYTVGLQLSWANRSSSVGRRESSNQFNFNIFGRFFLRSDSRALPQ